LSTGAPKDKTVIKCLIKHYKPCFYCPEVNIESTEFVVRITLQYMNNILHVKM